MDESVSRVAGRVFISYRREETAWQAGWLFDRLADRFGRDQIFKDIDSIQLGDDFVEVITAAVGSCDVLLALIGDRWLTISDERGRIRLDNPKDFVRVEIEAALTRNVRVIPILVEGARMPRPDQLPSSLAKLVRRQALDLSPGRFEFDTGRLFKVLDSTLADVHAEPVEQLQRQIHERAATRDWDAVLAVNENLATVDPDAAGPDGLAGTTREQVTGRREAKQVVAAHRRQIARLQRQIHERAAAHDWDAVLAVNEELVALDPAEADPDGLASTARRQITRRREAEQAVAAHRQRVEQLQRQIRERPGHGRSDGVASTAREQITGRRETEPAAAAHRQQIEQLQRQIHERAAAHDWDAVLAVNDALLAIDPATADPDGLASTARKQITRRRDA